MSVSYNISAYVPFSLLGLAVSCEHWSGIPYKQDKNNKRLNRMNSKQDMRMSINKLKSKKNISMKIQQKSTKQNLWVQNPGPGATERNQAIISRFSQK